MSVRRRPVPQSARALCSKQCGAQCCKSSIVPLTAEEAENVMRLARARGLPAPELHPSETAGRSDGKPYRMYGHPCVFLSRSNLCIIHSNRPEHCRAFPTGYMESCLLSIRLYGDG